jgi:hypothetical protein
MSFVDIAKEVGWRWQQMEPSAKQKYELEAARDIQEYEDRMREYKQTSSYQEYQEYLLTFRKAPVKPTRPKLRNQPPYEASFSTSAFSTTQAGRHTSNSPSSDTMSLSHQDKELLSYAMGEFRRLIAEYGNVEAFHPGHPPPRELFRSSMLALVETAGPLIYTWDTSSAKQLLDNTSNESTADHISIAELYIASALGSCFCVPPVDLSVSHKLMVTGVAILDELTLSDLPANRLLRILACLAIYSSQERHMSCKALISEFNETAV